MNNTPMTKTEALKIFREELSRIGFPLELAQAGLPAARSKARKEWKFFTGCLLKAKLITSRQYNTWTNPY